MGEKDAVRSAIEKAILRIPALEPPHEPDQSREIPRWGC